MKLNNNNFSDGKHIGHALGYFGEYSLAGIYLEDVDYGDDSTYREPHYDEAWIETDQDDYRGVVENSIEDKILIDIFQDKPICDLFLLYLKQWLNENTIDENYRKQIEDWYFSDKPKYKVF